jgi:hypothetical protein
VSRPSGRAGRVLAPALVVLFFVAAFLAVAAGRSAGTHRVAAADESGVVSLSPTGSDANACTAAQPCRTLARGYEVAAPGQVVELQSGTYSGDQIVSGATKSGAKPIVFRPAKGAAPVIDGEIRVRSLAHLEFQRLSFFDFYLEQGSRDITFRNSTMRYFFVRSSTNVRLLGGSVGPSDDATSPTIGAAGQSAPPSRTVMIDGVRFHDITRARNPSGHVECLFIQESISVTIRRSRFEHCDVMDLYVNDIVGGPVPRAVTLENNFFDRPTDGGFYAIDFAWNPGDVDQDHVVRYNSIDGSLRFAPGTYRNVQVYGNIGDLNNCTSGVSFSYNVWSDRTCGAHDVRAAHGFVDTSTFDLRLAKRAAAVDHGDPKRFPRTDIFGHKRPRGRAPDAGAVESR